MTALQQLIMADLKNNPASTAKEIGDRIGRSASATATSLTFLRGDRAVTDGTILTPNRANRPDPIRWTAV